MAHLSGIGIGTYARALAAALAIGAAVLSLSPGQANALPIDNGNRCWIDNGDELEAFLPGQVIHDGPLTGVCMGTEWYWFLTPGR